MKTEVIPEARGTTAFFLVISLAFVSIAVFIMPRQPLKSELEAIFCGGFFGLCAFVFCWRLLRPGNLTLDQDGFTVVDLFGRPRKTLWRDVTEFFELRLTRGGTLIAFNYVEGHAPKSRLIGLARGIGAEGTVSGLYCGSRKALIAKLNSYRDAALERA